MIEPLLDKVTVAAGRRCRVAWFNPPFLPPHEETTQALGICFTAQRQIVLVTRNGDDWSLPGGTVEPGETLELDPFSADHEMIARMLVSPEDFRTTLFWGREPTAGLILERGLEIEEDLTR